MGILEDTIAGWVGGFVGLLIGHPADTIKVRQQSMNEEFLVTVNALRKRGIISFYRGMLAPLLSVGPSNAVFFAVYGSCLRCFQGDSNSEERVDLDDPRWIETVFLSGCTAGLAQVLVTCPSELIKTTLQIKAESAKGKLLYSAPYNNTKGAIGYIWKTHGIRGFYRGLVPMFLRDVPTSGVYMYVYETLVPRGDFDISKQIVAGGLAGVASWIATIPFDVVKSRIQSDNPNSPQYKGLRDCFRKTYRDEGLGVFFKGFWLIIGRAFPVSASAFIGYEYCLLLFKHFS